MDGFKAIGTNNYWFAVHVFSLGVYIFQWHVLFLPQYFLFIRYRTG